MKLDHLESFLAVTRYPWVQRGRLSEQRLGKFVDWIREHY